MKKIFGVIFVLLAFAVLVSSYNLFEQSDIRKSPTVRSVTLYDTSATSYQNKSNLSFNTTGYFIDQSTGLRFKSSIQDKLYREFEKGQNKPIAIEKELNLDTIESSSLGALYKFLASILILLFVFFTGCVIIFRCGKK